MGIQRLGERKVRRFARETGLDLNGVWSNGDSASAGFRTNDDRHGWLDRKTLEWGFYDDNDNHHVSTCRKMEWPLPLGTIYEGEPVPIT